MKIEKMGQDFFFFFEKMGQDLSYNLYSEIFFLFLKVFK